MKVRTLEKSGVSTTEFVGAAFDSILYAKRRQKSTHD
jgi:hypothetical protein